MITNVMGSCIDEGAGQSFDFVMSICSCLIVFKALRSHKPNESNRGGKNSTTLRTARWFTHRLEGSLIARIKKNVATKEINLCRIKHAVGVEDLSQG